MIDDKLFNLFDESLRIVSACPVCKRRYDPIEAKILMERNDAHLLYVKCHSCGSAILAVILASNSGMSSLGLVTDLSSDEVLRFKDDKPVEYNDVIAMHCYLSKEKVSIEHIL